MSFGESVWERTRGRDALGERAYLGAVSGFTVYGLVLASVIGYMTMDWKPGILGFLFIGLAIPIAGVFIALSSDHWPISLFGYTLIVVGLGAIIGPSVALYDTSVVMTAFAATAGVSIAMSVVGIVYPRLLLGWGGYFFAALFALLLVRVGQLFMAGFGVSPTVWDWPFIDYAAALLFSLYIIYDWNRAMDLPKTIDNAVDAAVAIFLDIANLFINLLRIFGGRGGRN